MINLLTDEKMTNIFKLTILVILFEFSNQIEIPTSSGTVTGTKLQILNRCVYGFFGVPYAKPPVGQLRFKNPEPVENCNCVLNTVEKKPSCIQKPITPIPPIKDEMSEDCLYLNIWVPVCPKEKKPLSTMVWIHSGGFLTGSGNEIHSNGGFIASIGCVIVVSFNYRLGVFGFSNFNTDEAPGNMGMMDQVMAMQWVNKNIAAFGGDPKDVTLFGHSAGAVSISLHLISPLTECLFSRVIIISLNIYRIGNVPTAVEPSHNTGISETIASKAGCNQLNPRDKVNCLRTIDPFILATILEEYVESRQTVKGLLPQITGPYLPDGDNVNIHCSDVIIGNVRDEGSFLLKVFHPKFEYQENPTLTKEEGRNVIEKYFGGFELSQEDLDRIYYRYLGYLPNEDSTLIVNQTYKALGEGSFTCPSYFLAEQLSEFVRQSCYCKYVRYYIFNHSKILCNLPDWHGVTHREELPYLFGEPYRIPDCFTFEEVCFSERIIKLSSTYSKTGNPTCPNIIWPPFDENKYSVEVQLRDIIIQKDPLKETCDFWRGIYKIKFFKS